MTYDPYEIFPPGDQIFEFNGVEMTVRECPDSLARKHMGLGHFYASGRDVIEGNWPYNPDNCEFAVFDQGWWTRDETTLICAGCGLDCT